MKASCFLLLIFLLFTSAFIIGCDDDDDDDDGGAPADDDNAADDDDDDAVDDDDDDDDYGPVEVIWDYVFVDAPAPPPNPDNYAQTPVEFNKVPVMRFRQDTGDDPPRPVSTILIMLPGNVAGLNDFYFMAQDMITVAEGDLELWAVDRRTNLLEDQVGLDAAEAAKDPRIVIQYYFEGLEIDGHTYLDFLDPYSPETDFMSEWGVDTFMRDIRAVIHKIPEENRQTNVIIGGHSRGVGYAQMYVAYEFEQGVIGADDVAGILLCDGARRYEEITENEYLTQIDELRAGILERHNSTSPSAQELPILAQYLAMAATEGFGAGDPEMGPDGVLQDRKVFNILEPLLAWFSGCEYTNEAFFGTALDNSSGLPGDYYGSFGKMTGGPVEQGLLGDHCAERGTVYSWANYDEVDPPELSDVQKFIQMTYIGPADFGDMFMSTRYDLDDWSSGPLETEGTWMHNYLRYYTSRVDIPVYALEGKLMIGTSFYSDYQAALPPVKGQDKPRSEVGFHVHTVPKWGHIDTVLVQPEYNTFFTDFLQWSGQWTTGKVQVDPFGH